MLSVLLAEQPEIMKQLAEFYFRGGKIIDVSFGLGKLSALVPNIVGVDMDTRSKATVIADSRALPFQNGSFVGAIFDPPYLYGRRSQSLTSNPDAWRDVHSRNDSPAAFRDLVRGTAEELRRVLVSDGRTIVKVADSRRDGMLVTNHIIVIEEFVAAGHSLHDVLIYLRTGTGLFKNRRSAQSAHGYYLAFESTANAHAQTDNVIQLSSTSNKAVDTKSTGKDRKTDRRRAA